MVPATGQEQIISSGTGIQVGIRPESCGPETLFEEKLAGVALEVQYEGDRWRIRMECQGVALTLFWPSPCLTCPPEVGQLLGFSLDTSSLLILPEDHRKKE